MFLRNASGCFFYNIFQQRCIKLVAYIFGNNNKQKKKIKVAVKSFFFQFEEGIKFQ